MKKDEMSRAGKTHEQNIDECRSLVENPEDNMILER
jgi:hypothetical protein